MKLPGWKPLGFAVYEHASGIRAHAYGVCGLSPGPLVWGTQWPESMVLDRFIRQNGGNRRRGVLAWAMHLMRSGRFEAMTPLLTPARKLARLPIIGGVQ